MEETMDSAICAKGLGKRYGSLTALHPLDLTVKKGEVLGYLGPNGAGKTTTIRALLGLIRPTAGAAEIFGMDVQTDKVAVHRRLAYVPGEPALWPALTGEETLDLLGNLHGSYDKVYRKQLISRFDFDPRKKVRTYSKGNRQKINLIAALMTRAELLILDEPTAGLDPLMEQVFRECVTEDKKNGQTIFLSSHILGEVEAICDRVAILRAGKLIELGTLAEMRHLSAVTVDATFGGKVPAIKQLPGVKNVQVTGKELRFQVQGPIENVLGAIAGAKPLTLFIREASLEELFLSLYGADESVVTPKKAPSHER
jgi:ABC-2 type transport system ATP-binding protein